MTYKCTHAYISSFHKCLDTHSAIFLSRDFFALDPFLSRDFCLEFATKNAACVNGTIEITLEANPARYRGEFATSKSRRIRVMCVKALKGVFKLLLNTGHSYHTLEIFIDILMMLYLVYLSNKEQEEYCLSMFFC